MKTATAFDTSISTVEALTNAYEDLKKQLKGTPTWMTVHCTFQHSGKILTDTLEKLAPGVPFQGGTSCLGVMTEKGFHSDEGLSLGIFGIRDEAGTYAIGYADEGSNSRLTGKEAIAKALQESGKDTPPVLVWITCAPGDEEAVLAGIEEGLAGANTPIIGGSSADNTIEGNWFQITNGQVMQNGTVVTALYPSKPVRYAFDNGYTPTEHTGIVTRANGRKILTINHRPAAEVYNEWTGGLINDHMDGGNILALSTLQPLGREANWARGTTLYQLAHPEAVIEEQAITLFTKAERGERLVLMESTTEHLVSRVNKVTAPALRKITDPATQIAGALVIYCAGCMLAVQDDMDEVSRQFSKELGGQPFMGLFTFGEQGCALLGENTHANLMMSIIVFEN